MGQLVSQLGTWMQTVGLSWLVLRWTNSPTALGTVLACQFFPSLALSLYGGLLADRISKRRLLVITQTVLMVQAALLAWIASWPHASVYWLYGLGLLAGTATAVDGPTRQAFVPEMVSQAQLSSAVALNSAQFNLSRVIGPALGGLVVGQWGETVCFALNAVSFLFVLGALAAMRGLTPAPPAPPKDALADILAGLRYSLATAEPALILLLAAFLGTFGFEFAAVLPLIAKYTLKTGSEGLGVLTSVVGAGSLACSLFFAFARRGGVGTLLAGSLLFSLALFGLGLTHDERLIYLCLFAWGVADIMFFSTALTRLQLRTPPEMRGRLISVFLLLITGTSPVGSYLVGFLATRLGVDPAVRTLGVICLVGTALGIAFRLVKRGQFPAEEGEKVQDAHSFRRH